MSGNSSEHEDNGLVDEPQWRTTMEFKGSRMKNNAWGNQKRNQNKIVTECKACFSSASVQSARCNQEVSDLRSAELKSAGLKIVLIDGLKQLSKVEARRPLYTQKKWRIIASATSDQNNNKKRITANFGRRCYAVIRICGRIETMRPALSRIREGTEYNRNNRPAPSCI